MQLRWEFAEKHIARLEPILQIFLRPNVIFLILIQVFLMKLTVWTLWFWKFGHKFFFQNMFLFVYESFLVYILRCDILLFDDAWSLWACFTNLIQLSDIDTFIFILLRNIHDKLWCKLRLLKRWYLIFNCRIDHFPNRITGLGTNQFNFLRVAWQHFCGHSTRKTFF